VYIPYKAKDGDAGNGTGCSDDASDTAGQETIKMTAEDGGGRVQIHIDEWNNQEDPAWKSYLQISADASADGGG
jgi:hypothetical protein